MQLACRLQPLARVQYYGRSAPRLCSHLPLPHPTPAPLATCAGVPPVRVRSLGADDPGPAAERLPDQRDCAQHPQAQGCARAAADAADAGRVAHTRAAGWGALLHWHVCRLGGSASAVRRRRAATPLGGWVPLHLHIVWLYPWRSLLLFSLPFTMQASSPSPRRLANTRVSGLNGQDRAG